GAASTAGAPGPLSSWSFAEGTTRPGFESYLTVANPGDGSVNGTVTFLLAGGSPVTAPVTVAGRARSTVAIHQVVPAGKDFGIRLDMSGPVVAERASYFDYQGRVTGGSDVLGSELGGHFVSGVGSVRAGFGS